MVNPIASAFNFFFHILNNIPAPIMYLLYLSLGLAVITIVVKLIFRG